MDECINRYDTLKALNEYMDSIHPFTTIDIMRKSEIICCEQIISNVPAADVVEVVRCKECKFWKDIHVLQNDGRERQYTAEEYDSDFTLMTPCVSSSVGINVGSKCMYDDQSGYIVDKTVFRGADDYCSKGEKRPCSYEKWWGIVDGYYPKEET